MASRPTRLGSVVFSIGLGVLYAGAEFVRQRWWVPSPEGVPGDTGGDVLAFLALGVVVFGLPSLVVEIAGWSARSRNLVRIVALSAGLLPTLYLAVERQSGLEGWAWASFDVVGRLGILYLLCASLGGSVLFSTLLWWFSRRVDRTLRWLRFVAVPVVPLAVAHLVLVLAGGDDAWRAPPLAHDRPSPDAPNLLLITVDTLRQDALAAYGGPTSSFDGSVSDAMAFDGWAPSPWTQPSMASLFTAVVPSGHGCDREHEPSTEVAWWPETVREAGWATGAIVTNPYLHRRFGFARGFESVRHADELSRLEPIARTLWAEWAQRQWIVLRQTDRGDRIAGSAVSWLGNTPEERPWFLWVHLLDPHLPYHARGEDGALRGDLEAVETLGEMYGPGGFADLLGVREGRVAVTDSMRTALEELYRSEVRFALHQVGRILGAAEAASGDRRLVWALTSDHGEEFWDDGGFEHGHSLHASVLRVPLIVGGAGEPGEGGTMRLIDLGPFLLERIGLGGRFDPRLSAGLLEGDEDLARFGVGEPTRPAAVDSLCVLPPVLAESMLYGPERTLLLHPSGLREERDDETGTVGRTRLCSPPDSVPELPWRALDLWRERTRERGSERTIDPDLARRLRALGYAH